MKPERPQSDGPVPVRDWIGYASMLLAIVLLIADYTIVETNIPDLVRDFALSVDEIGELTRRESCITCNRNTRLLISQARNRGSVRRLTLAAPTSGYDGRGVLPGGKQ